MMEKIYLDRDEAYPVYAPSEWDHHTEVEMPDGFMRRYRRVQRQYEEIQEEMGAAWRKAHGQQDPDHDTLCESVMVDTREHGKVPSSCHCVARRAEREARDA